MPDTTIVEDTDTSVATVYLATCDRCGNDRWPMIFLNPNTRNSWIANHEDATGHDAAPGEVQVPNRLRDGRTIPHIQRDIDGSPVTPRYHDQIETLRHELDGFHFSQEALKLTTREKRLLYIAEQLGHTLDSIYGGFFR
jgi:hypothetical protein